MLYKLGDIPENYGENVGGERVLFRTNTKDMARLGYSQGPSGDYRFITYVDVEASPVMTQDGLRYDVDFVCYGFPYRGEPPDASEATE